MAFAEVDGARLYYEDSGGSGAPLVLVHGVVGNSDSFQQQVPAFRDAGFRVIRFDLRGHGRSRPLPGRETEGSIAGDLEMLAMRLRLQPFHLVSQAYGAFGAIEFALDNPSRLRALVVSTSYGGITDEKFVELRAKYVPESVNALPAHERELGASYRERNADGVLRFLAIDDANPVHPPRRQQLRTPTTLQRLQGMRVPTLVIAADQDVLAPPIVMRGIAVCIPGSTFSVIEGAGHCAYWEKPREWNQLVIDFLRDKQ